MASRRADAGSAVVSHDRGALVAFGMAMDHQDSVPALAVLDGLPVAEHLDRCDVTFAKACSHWFFLGQSEKPAERVISADPEGWYKPDREQMGERNYADHLRAIHDLATIHAMCEDYRAGLGIDYEHDDADRRAGRQVSCPTPVVWSIQDDMEELYGEPLAIWRTWAPDVRAERIDSGHHMAEEAPEQPVSMLEVFFADAAAAR